MTCRREVPRMPSLAGLVCSFGSAAKLKCKPLSVALIGLLLGSKPSAMAPSITPEIACPDPCDSSLVTATCKARSLRLSVDVPTACVNTAEVL